MTAMVDNRQTTHEAGVPITQEELARIHRLEQLGCLDSVGLLNVYSYSEDRWEARQQFKQRFAFYNLIKLEELDIISTLWVQYMDFCVPPQLLLDPKRYNPDPAVARAEFERRLSMYDCYKGVMGDFGRPRSGKSGFAAVHSWHGKQWFDLPVVSYKFKFAHDYGKFFYIRDEELLEELSKVTKIVEGKTADAEGMVKWESQDAKDQAMFKFRNAQIIIEEAHKVFPRSGFTRLGRILYHSLIKEWGHYQSQTVLITHEPDDLNKHILKHLTHEVWVSRNKTLDRTSDVRIRNTETGQMKPLIHLKRDIYYPLWTHNAPIALESNISKKDADKLTIRKEGEE